MGKIRLSDGGEYHRPGHPHVFRPEDRAAAHYLKAVEAVAPEVRRQLSEEVLGKNRFPSEFPRWRGLGLFPTRITHKPIPGQPRGPQRERFEQARPFLRALRLWLSEYYMWSPFVLDLLYRTLELWAVIDREIAGLQGSICEAEEYEKQRPMTKEDQQIVESEKARLEFLTPERQGWGWWVDFLASDITVPQLDAWLAASGLCPPSMPGTIILNMPSSPRAAALWTHERLTRATSKTHGVSSLGGDNRELLVRCDRLDIDIGWEPAGPAPRFELVMVGWRPEEETWAAAKGRFESGFKEQLKVYRAAIEKRLQSGQLHPRPRDSAKGKWGEPYRWEAVPTKYGDEHFQWLALRQVKGLRPQEIADRPGIRKSVSAVNEAIEGTARLLQMKLRPVRPGPPSVLGD